MTDILEALAQLSVLVFVIGSMLSLGLSLTMKQIIDPLKNVRLVVLALVANFVLVPILAYLLALAFSLEDSLGLVKSQILDRVSGVNKECDGRDSERMKA